MRLNQTDFKILDALRDGRNVAPNIALLINADRSYINAELTKLHDYGLVKRVGPYEQSGLYQLTESGRIAAKNPDAYEDDSIQFEDFIQTPDH